MALVKDVLLYGTNGARPAASSANDGKFYRETDTGKTYQSNGSSWTLVADNSAISTIVSDWKESVRAATTANITLSGTQTIDGVSVIAGDRVLVKDQSTGANNGIYVCASGSWSRATDADTSAEVTADLAVFVEEGTANGDKIFILTTNNPITLGSTSLTFTALAAGGAGSDTTAIHDNESGEISALTEKTTLHNDDLFIIEDSEASNVKKKVKKSNVGGGVNSGTSFPGSPSNNDLYYRTDRDILYFYDSGSSSWLSVNIYYVTPTVGDGGAPPYSATGTNGYAVPDPTYGWYLLNLESTTGVFGTNNGSNYWTVGLDRRNASNTNNNITSHNTSADTASNWVQHSTAINAVLDSSAKILIFTHTKTSAPANLYVSARLSYRLIG